MIWIVGGPSSAGKSRFIASPLAKKVTGLAEGTRVWFPKELGAAGPARGEDAFVHYNILRPFQRVERPAEVVVGPSTFAGDPKWREILALPGEKRAVVVVTDRATLIERVKRRAVIETGDGREYGAAKWLRIYESIDLAAVYREWNAELARHGIRAIEVDGGIDS